MKLIKFILYLLILAGFLLLGCQKDSPLEKVFFITGGFVKTDGFILNECDEPYPGPHIYEFANLNGNQQAKQTDYVYDMWYDMNFYCEHYDGDDLVTYEGSALGSKKMAMQVLFDEVGNYYLLPMLKEQAIQELTDELILYKKMAEGSLPIFCSLIPGMIHMGMGDYKGSSPMIEGVVSNWGNDKIVLSGKDTLYYSSEETYENRMVISEWRIELEAR